MSLRLIQFWGALLFCVMPVYAFGGNCSLAARSRRLIYITIITSTDNEDCCLQRLFGLISQEVRAKALSNCRWSRRFSGPVGLQGGLRTIPSIVFRSGKHQHEDEN